MSSMKSGWLSIQSSGILGVAAVMVSFVCANCARRRSALPDCAYFFFASGIDGGLPISAMRPFSAINPSKTFSEAPMRGEPK